MVGSDEMPVTALLLSLLPVGLGLDSTDGLNDDFDPDSCVGVGVDNMVGANEAVITLPLEVAETPKSIASDRTARLLYLCIPYDRGQNQQSQNKAVIKKNV